MASRRQKGRAKDMADIERRMDALVKPAPSPSWDYALVRAGATIEMGDAEAFASFFARWREDASLELTRMDATGHVVTLVAGPAAVRHDRQRSEATIHQRYPCQWLDDRGWRYDRGSLGTVVQNLTYASADRAPDHESLDGYRVAHAAGPWRRKAGEFIAVEDMETVHVQNVVNMLQRGHNITGGEWWSTDPGILLRRCWSIRMRLELIRRGLPDVEFSSGIPDRL